MFSSAQVLVFAVAQEISTPRTAATALALTNMFVMAGGMIFQPLLGRILDMSNPDVAAGGAEAFTVGDYQLALSILPIGLLITVFVSFLLKETGGRIVKKQRQK
jgi:hypothetical protein